MKKIIIAIDGYSSCGKSTLARELARVLHYIYIDTGAMYRAVTLYFINHNIDFKNEEEVTNALNNISIDFRKIKSEIHTFLNSQDVETSIRSMQVSELVSEVSAISSVRSFLVQQQQAMEQQKGIVMDGRDIGTVVFPSAELKIFLTASPEIRATRRKKEYEQKGIDISLEEVKNNLAHRDHIDSTREDSPLRQAADAILLDNSYLTKEEQLKFVLDLMSEKFNLH
ncbi:MAG TPA: (d)CMP kinase [Saprospiraceae bacterium]|nr:(d)CMP kinase [Saprospiraceae bacterium]HMV23263.1 (d)CMP kinase [Saprospiraceae bacterium]HMW75533.1 (d)CMP kinase [Saprospiraceae bacterium]HMX82793.1 (d)CMP kinase [Saprospiraceae bacterium]HMX86226.1 (d)CMP kinase [Saprospiraceae bacterium]